MMASMTRKRKSAQLRVESPVNGDEDYDCSVTKRCRSGADDQRISLSENGAGEKQVIDVDATASQEVQQIAKKYVKHDTFWLLDGTILVQIGETRFKLHRSVLVEQSLWLWDLIENSQHDKCIYADEETGATVYCLDSLGIAVQDFVALLNALNNAITYVYDPPSLKVVAAILRAADSLGFDQYRTYATRYFEEEWPDDVDEVTTQRLKCAADMVPLARRYGIKSFLKRALYELVRAEGFRQETDPCKEDDHDGGTDSDRPVLSVSDYWLLLHAREKLTSFWMGKAVPPLQMFVCHSLSPEDRKNCAVSQSKTRMLYDTLIHDSKIFEKYKYDPICGLEAILNAPWAHGKKWSSTYGKDLPTTNARLCHGCARGWRSVWRMEKLQLWDDLGDWFELSENDEELDDTSVEE